MIQMQKRELVTLDEVTAVYEFNVVCPEGFVAKGAEQIHLYGMALEEGWRKFRNTAYFASSVSDFLLPQAPPDISLLQSEGGVIPEPIPVEIDIADSMNAPALKALGRMHFVRKQGVFSIEDRLWETCFKSWTIHGHAPNSSVVRLALDCYGHFKIV